MKTKICLFLLFCFYTTFSPAAFVSKQTLEPVETGVAIPATGNKLQKVKLNFFQKLFLTITGRKKTLTDAINGDGLANTSLIFGVTGFFLLASIFIGSGLAALASIPLSISAIITGSKALKRGTNYSSKAKAGKTLGTVTLVLIMLLFGVVLIALSLWKGIFVY